MTLPVVPPAAPLVPAYPPLGSPTFNNDAYAVGTAMPSVVAGIKAIADAAYTNALSASEDAAIAQAQAAAAQAAVNAAMWVSGTNYGPGLVAWSPADRQSYRRNTPGGVSTVDPSLDTTGWTRVSGGDSLPQFLLMAQGIK